MRPGEAARPHGSGISAHMLRWEHPVTPVMSQVSRARSHDAGLLRSTPFASLRLVDPPLRSAQSCGAPLRIFPFRHSIHESHIVCRGAHAFGRIGVGFCPVDSKVKAALYHLSTIANGALCSRVVMKMQ
jgi:hypothetical protein